MKIPELPQVEFDEFPSDNNTKLCIFTQLRYPVPDLSKMRKNGRKVSLLCTESHILTLGRFKNLPRDLFQYSLPNRMAWLQIDSSKVDGLDTPFAVACLPIGNASESVMLLIYLINDIQIPRRLILYTGLFRECREVLMNDLFLKYKPKISDLYIDNTFASSSHLDAIQNLQACDTINEIVDHFKHHKIQIELGMFDSLDFLVDLARRHRLHVKLDPLQQIFFYKSPYKHLFEYDANINNSKYLNEHFQFKGRPMVYVVPYTDKDQETFKTNYHQRSIITIRLISSKVDPWRAQYNGLIYVSHFCHAGAYTLSQLIHETKPKRVHSIVEFEICNDSMAKIPNEILNKGCATVNSFDVHHQLVDVTVDDTKSTHKSSAKIRSFLDPSTAIEEEMESEQILNTYEDTPNSMSNFILGDEVIEISDDESVTVNTMFESSSKKRPSDANDSTEDEVNNNPQRQAKRVKVNIVSTSQPISQRNGAEKNSLHSSEEFEHESSSDSGGVFVFPDSYD